MNRRRLYRCVHDQKIAGVCSGIAEYFDVDPAWVRIAFLVALFMGGIGFVAYIAMAIIVPVEPATYPAPGPWQPGNERWGTPQAGAAAGAAAEGTDPADPNAADTTQTFDASGAPAGYPGAAPAEWQAAQWHATYAGQRAGRGGRGAQFLGIVLILFGGVMLANAYLPGWNWNFTWPFFLLAVGAILVLGSLTRRNEEQ